jgi:hypothetical protein
VDEVRRAAAGATTEVHHEAGAGPGVRYTAAVALRRAQGVAAEGYKGSCAAPDVARLARCVDITFLEDSQPIFGWAKSRDGCDRPYFRAFAGEVARLGEPGPRTQ